MHEASLVRALVAQIERIARAHGAVAVRSARVKLGPLAHVDAAHLREHFEVAARGSLAEGATLDVTLTDELHELTLESLEVEEPEEETR